ncbi:DUF1351 domain-containing protein [Clostridium beijerinckii]|uniref:DUF1351 domain-containing protein n=1 Tax=Clostridium beijerinckii TaxID=1520 RepID=A0A7X9SMD9_CLOBE|nr:DUF1351 domain-containing protein [Clostridium beijerinckii]
MKELQVNKQLPVISTNFEEVKASLIETVNKYKGIVVTEEGLKDCKATQKELAGLRNKIDDYRKAVKKDVSEPINVFEKQCKELISLVADAEQPIKEGIEVFDNKRREEKRQKALEFISESVQAHNLSEKYAKRLTVLDKYLTLSGSLKSIKDDIEQRTLMLLQEQDRELGVLQVIQGTIKGANETIKTPLKLQDFQNLIDMNYPVAKIIEEINKRAAMIREAERPKPVEPLKEEIKEPEPTKEQVSIPVDIKTKEAAKPKEEPLFFYEIRVVANFENMKKLTELLKGDGFDYTVKDKGRTQK